MSTRSCYHHSKIASKTNCINKLNSQNRNCYPIPTFLNKPTALRMLNSREREKKQKGKESHDSSSPFEERPESQAAWAEVCTWRACSETPLRAPDQNRRESADRRGTTALRFLKQQSVVHGKIGWSEAVDSRSPKPAAGAVGDGGERLRRQPPARDLGRPPTQLTLGVGKGRNETRGDLALVLP